MTNSPRLQASQKAWLSMDGTGIGKGVSSGMTGYLRRIIAPTPSPVSTSTNSVSGTWAVEQTAKLPDTFNNMIHRVDVGLRKMPSSGVDRQLTANLDSAAFDKCTTLTLGAEPVVLQGEEERVH